MENNSILHMLGKLDGKMDAIMNTTMMHSERLNRLEERHYLLASQVQTIETTTALTTNSKKAMWSIIVSVGALAAATFNAVKSFWIH